MNKQVHIQESRADPKLEDGLYGSEQGQQSK